MDPKRKQKLERIKTIGGAKPSPLRIVDKNASIGAALSDLRKQLAFQKSVRDLRPEKTQISGAVQFLRREASNSSDILEAKSVGELFRAYKIPQSIRLPGDIKASTSLSRLSSAQRGLVFQMLTSANPNKAFMESTLRLRLFGGHRL